MKRTTSLDCTGLTRWSGQMVLAGLIMGLALARPAWSQSGSEEKAPWRVGLARVVITPEKPLWMIGYRSQARFRPSEGKLNDLHAKAMALEDSEGHRAVLVTLDLCIIGPAEAKALFDRLVSETGLERRQLLVNLSHTHSGPITGDAPEYLDFPLPEEDRRATRQYTAKVQDSVCEVAKAALADLKPARLSWGKGKCDFVRNRRLYDEQGRYRGMGPNPEKYVDDAVPVLRVDAPDGSVRALLFGCACHPVTLCDNNLKISGDYAGFAQDDVEAKHPGVQAMFMQGCGADANSHPRCGPNQEENARKQGESLAAEVCRVAEGALQPVRGPLRVGYTEAKAPLQPVPSREELKKISGAMTHNSRRMLAALERNQPLPTHHAQPLAVWQFGRDLTLVAISGEVVSAYAKLVQQALGPERLWVAGYSNEVDGYLADAAIVAEGGYEARGLFGDIGLYAADAQDAVVAAIRQLASQAGRPQP